MVSAKQRNLILLLLFIGWAIGNFDRYFINYAILSIADDLQLNPASTGLILSSFFLGYALMQIPGGWLADKLGSRKVLIVSSSNVVDFYRNDWSGLVIDFDDCYPFLVRNWGRWIPAFKFEIDITNVSK